MIEYIVMMFTHIIKVMQYFTGQVLPELTLSQLPMFIEEYLYYIAKVIAIYVTIFF